MTAKLIKPRPAPRGVQPEGPRDVSALRPAGYNPRKISKHQLAKLGDSMRKFGDLSGIVLNTKTGNLVGGHQRIKHFDPTWPVLVDERLPAPDAVGTVARGHVATPFGKWTFREVCWTEAIEKAANIAANAHGGDFDISLLEPMIRDLKAAGEDLDVLGLDAHMIERLAGVLGAIVEDEPPAPPKNPFSKPGDLWIMGEHRLLCGSSTSSDDVKRLMNTRMADMVLTDPPYGVSYVGKTKKALTIENDDMDEAQLKILVEDAFGLAEGCSRPGAYWFATVPAGPLHLVFAEYWKRRGILRQIMVWVKDSMVLGHSEYHYKHEPILFGWTDGPRNKNSDRTRTTVWEHPRPKASREHPTMKPVALWAQAILDCTQCGDIIYDPFIGSGTTIVAAEQTGRRCYGMEISPAYCDVIVNRWQNLTGRKATKS